MIIAKQNKNKKPLSEMDVDSLFPKDQPIVIISLVYLPPNTQVRSAVSNVLVRSEVSKLDKWSQAYKFGHLNQALKLV